MKSTERNARSEGYLDGLEGRASRAGNYRPESYAVAYSAGHVDGIASRERTRHKLRGFADYAFAPPRGATEMEARNPEFRKGRFSSVFGMPYGGQQVPKSPTGDSYLDMMLESYRKEFPDMARQWNNWQTQGMRVVRMTARDLVDEDAPEFAALEWMETRDARGRAYLELQALIASGDFRLRVPVVIGFDLGEELPAPLANSQPARLHREGEKAVKSVFVEVPGSRWSEPNNRKD